MLLSIADILAPHHCRSCGEIGSVLCEYCKYDIANESFGRCLVCLGPTGGDQALCGRCHPSYRRAWCVGERSGVLELLINDYKFERVRSTNQVLADLIDYVVPILPADIRVVPIPTIAPHIRQRGYGHIELVAKRLAQKRKLSYYPALRRLTNATQHGANRSTRLSQAKTAFVSRPLESGVYLLVDDVFTTGATLEYASKALLEAGATEVWVVVVSRQPVEK